MPDPPTKQLRALARCAHSDLCRHLHRIVTDLANSDPPLHFGDSYGEGQWCTLCGNEIHATATHTPDCPWLRAREATRQENPE